MRRYTALERIEDELNAFYQKQSFQSMEENYGLFRRLCFKADSLYNSKAALRCICEYCLLYLNYCNIDATQLLISSLGSQAEAFVQRSAQIQKDLKYFGKRLAEMKTVGNYREELFLFWCILETNVIIHEGNEQEKLENKLYRAGGLFSSCVRIIMRARKVGNLQGKLWMELFERKGLSPRERYYLFAGACILHAHEYALISQLGERVEADYLNYDYSYPVYVTVILKNAQAQRANAQMPLSPDESIARCWDSLSQKPAISTRCFRDNSRLIIPGVTLSPTKKSKALILTVLFGVTGLADLELGCYLRFIIKQMAFLTVLMSLINGVDYHKEPMIYLIMVALSLFLIIWEMVDVVFISKNKKYDGKNRLIVQ